MRDLVTHPPLDAGLPLRPKILPHFFPVSGHGLLLNLAQMRIVDLVRFPDTGEWARLLNWVAHPLGFRLSKSAAFDFGFALRVRQAQRERRRGRLAA
jgi:hypothetical protein